MSPRGSPRRSRRLVTGAAEIGEWTRRASLDVWRSACWKTLNESLRPDSALAAPHGRGYGQSRPRRTSCVDTSLPGRHPASPYDVLLRTRRPAYPLGPAPERRVGPGAAVDRHDVRADDRVGL